MAYNYAGILGPLAMFAALARGLVHASGPEDVIMAAWISLLVFACLGAAIGALADWTVGQSVRATLEVELASAKSNGS